MSVVNSFKFLVGATVVGSLLLGCQTASSEKDDVVKMLIIGNSFSISCLTYLPQLAADCDVKLDIASLYIGGCSLETHVTNARAERKAPSAAGKYLYNRITQNGPKKTLNNARLTDALARAKWDIVTIQQASHLSWKPESYEPWGDDLVAIVRELAPQAKIVVQETWSYTPFDRRLRKWGMTADEMYAKLARAYRDFAAKRGFGVIPMGDAVQAWRRELPVKYTDHSFGGDVVGGGRQKESDHFKRNADLTWSLNSDGFHLNEKGEYLQALVWAKFVLKADVSKPTSHPACVAAAEDMLMRKIVKELK